MASGCTRRPFFLFTAMFGSAFMLVGGLTFAVLHQRDRLAVTFVIVALAADQCGGVDSPQRAGSSARRHRSRGQGAGVSTLHTWLP